MQWEPVVADGYAPGDGYRVTSAAESRGVLTLELALRSGDLAASDAHIPALKVVVSKTESDVVNVRIVDRDAQRWEVPRWLYPKGSLGREIGEDEDFEFVLGDARYAFSYSEDPFTFQVVRKEDGYTLFDSSALPLVVDDQYLQIATAVGGDLSIYGVGESTREHFKMQVGEKSTLWTRDEASANTDVNTYGSHPFFLGLNSKGQAHGVFLFNSNGMDVTLEHDKLVYQAIGGVLDFHIVVGPTPAKVISQYTKLLGRPKLMPYWSYGYHQCRWGYKNTAALHEVMDRYVEENIPLDVVWADIDHMNRFHDFTLDPVNFAPQDMQALIKKLHESGRKFVPIVDPGISIDEKDPAYTTGLEMDIFIKDTLGKPVEGKVWPGPTVYPDFLHPKTLEYWQNQLQHFHDQAAFDGIWIDMNEASNFIPGHAAIDPDTNPLDHPPFAINNGKIKDPLFHHTISLTSLHHGGIREYDAHSLYGFSESIVTNAAVENITKKRAFVLSRSTFAGSGVHTAHWTGDNASTWNDLGWSIPTILKFGLFGVPMVGADIAGFGANTTMELCARWTALGAFYPFARNHNAIGCISQETYVWPETIKVGQKFIGMRYRLLPYIYTLGYHAHVDGTPIARPLYMEYPTDTNTHSIDRQFMLGNALLVTPVLYQSATSVTGYYPAGVWYNIFDYSRITSTGQSVTTTVTLYDMPVHMRGGTILAMHQNGTLTSTAARATPFDILVALPSSGSASGDLYLDDGVEIEGASSTIVTFSASAGSFSSTVTQNKYSAASSLLVNKLVVLGVTSKPSSVSVGTISSYDSTTQKLEITLSSQSIATGFTVTWKANAADAPSSFCSWM